MRAWYVVDNDKHMTAASMKMEKAIESALLSLEYSLVRYCWIYHPPTKKKTAGTR
jgi:hypothetical protein